MKYYHYLFFTILLFTSNANALQPTVEIYEQFDNLKMVAFIDKKDINANPVWKPDLSPIPLTVDEAIQAVKNFTKDSPASGAIREIEIRPLPKHEEHWHYLIKIADDAMITKFAVYFVLMNGKVIPAMIEPQGYK